MVIAVVLLVSLVIIKPTAPKSIVLLTGPEGSSYHQMGRGLAGGLRRLGLEAEVRVTTGGIDNVKQLADGAENRVAFAPSNVETLLGPKANTGQIVSLGSIAFEPFWLFCRSDLDVETIADLAGLKVATGAPDTVVDSIARTLLRTNAILDQVEVFSYGHHTLEGLEQELMDGSVDAAFATGIPTSPVIMRLLGHPDLSSLSFDRADAYEAWYPGVARIVIPEGIADLENNLPGEDLVLLSATTNLIALDTLYPGVVPLILQAVVETDTRRRFTTSSMHFPSSEHTSLVLDRAAARYYDHGETGLGKYLPYKVTRWLNHLGFVVLPLLTIAVVLLKLVPLGLKIWSRIQLVGMLKQLESVEKAHAAGSDPTELLVQLNELDKKTAGLFVPRSMVHDYIDDRQFLHDMRERLEESATDRS